MVAKSTKERMAPLNRITCYVCRKKSGPWHTEYDAKEDLIVRVCRKCTGKVAAKPQTTCPGCGCVHGV